MTRDPGAAEDATQQAFLRALEAPRPEVRDWRLWIRRVATREALQRVRTEGRRARREVVVGRERTGSGWEERSPAGGESASAVRGAVEALDPDLRAAVHLHHLEGLTIPDVSVVLGVSGRAVQKRLARAREELASSMRRAGFAGALVGAALFESDAFAALVDDAVPTNLAESTAAYVVRKWRGSAPASAATAGAGLLTGVLRGRPSALPVAVAVGVVGLGLLVSVVLDPRARPAALLEVARGTHAPHRTPAVDTDPAPGGTATPDTTGPRRDLFDISPEETGTVVSYRVPIEVRPLDENGLPLPPEQILAIRCEPMIGIDNLDGVDINKLAEGCELRREADRWVGEVRTTGRVMFEFLLGAPPTTEKMDGELFDALRERGSYVEGMVLIESHDRRSIAVVEPSATLQFLRPRFHPGNAPPLGCPDPAIEACVRGRIDIGLLRGTFRSWLSPSPDGGVFLPRFYLCEQGSEPPAWQPIPNRASSVPWEAQEPVSIGPLPSGRYRLLAYIPGFNLLERTIDVRGGAETDLGELLFTPSTHWVTGQVLRSDGTPLPGADVRIRTNALRDAAGGGIDLTMVPTDAEGRFQVTLDPRLDPLSFTVGTVRLDHEDWIPRSVGYVVLRMNTPPAQGEGTNGAE